MIYFLTLPMLIRQLYSQYNFSLFYLKSPDGGSFVNFRFPVAYIDLFKLLFFVPCSCRMLICWCYWLEFNISLSVFKSFFSFSFYQHLMRFWIYVKDHDSTYYSISLMKSDSLSICHIIMFTVSSIRNIQIPLTKCIYFRFLEYNII